MAFHISIRRHFKYYNCQQILKLKKYQIRFSFFSIFRLNKKEPYNLSLEYFIFWNTLSNSKSKNNCSILRHTPKIVVLFTIHKINVVIYQTRIMSVNLKILCLTSKDVYDLRLQYTMVQTVYLLPFVSFRTGVLNFFDSNAINRLYICKKHAVFSVSYVG